MQLPAKQLAWVTGPSGSNPDLSVLLVVVGHPHAGDEVALPLHLNFINIRDCKPILASPFSEGADFGSTSLNSGVGKKGFRSLRQFLGMVIFSEGGAYDNTS